MLRLKPGKQMQEFAINMESTLKEVEEWANAQINDPHETYRGFYPTEGERMDAIKGYMVFINEYCAYDGASGINERIRATLKDGAIKVREEA